jgi:hypothetical protein
MKTLSKSSLSIFARISTWLKNKKSEKQLVDYVIKAVEPKIKNAKGYRKRLQIPIQICLQHCKSMVAAVPGPLHLSQSDYYADPLIRAAFIGSAKIEDLLKNLQVPTGQENIALLTMSHRVTSEFGSKQEGNMVIADANLKSVTFSDQKIISLSTTLAASREKLEKICFEMILEAVSSRLAAMRTNLTELREHRERLQAMAEMFSGEHQAGHYFGHDTSLDHEKLEKVEQLLKENKGELTKALESVETTEDWLQILIDYLKMPEKMLNFQTTTIRLDWRNVIAGPADKQANNMTFAQCTLPGEMVRNAVLLSYTVKK